ncbi:MAG: hypothetical protein Q9223_002973 [Gallowayella weberi]
MPAREGEKLLRIALLSRALLVRPTDGVPQSLVHRRKLLARSLRERRKKGIVPVFISLGWFLFALSLSIADAFGQLGDNQTAHDLALGLLLAWLPVFVIATVVDRNLIGADSVRRKLNEFVDDVRNALLEPNTRRAFLNHYRRQEADLAWTRFLEDDNFYSSGFFSRFSGQGRVRWHYGVAHSITASMETAYIAARGRDWLRNSWEAEHSMIWAPVNDQGLVWFDFRMLWQMVVSIVVVGGTVFGAFILSSTNARQWIQRHRASISVPRVTTGLERHMSRVDSNKWKWMVTVTRQGLRWWQDATLRDRIEVTVLRFFDVCNSIWLAYLVCAQTFGADQNCDCFSANWGPGDGYIDFQSYDYYEGLDVFYYWGFGMGLSVIVMLSTIIFITYEFCTQSYLSSEDYDQAMRDEDSVE